MSKKCGKFQNVAGNSAGILYLVICKQSILTIDVVVVFVSKTPMLTERHINNSRHRTLFTLHWTR